MRYETRYVIVSYTNLEEMVFVRDYERAKRLARILAEDNPEGAGYLIFDAEAWGNDPFIRRDQALYSVNSWGSAERKGN